MTEQKYPAKVGFWRNSDDNFRSSVKGLEADQIEMLRNLKEGDRLVLWQVKGADDRAPVLELKVIKERDAV